MTHPDTDFHAWTLEAAERARARQLTEEDYDWIAEELEDMGKNRQHALKRQLRRLLMHLLKWQYQSPYRSRSWELTLWNAREEIADLLEENPSLKPFFHEIGEKIYQQARRKASVETKESPETFPATFDQAGWTWEQVLDFDFYPGPEQPKP
jgi:hypothetical protein